MEYLNERSIREKLRTDTFGQSMEVHDSIGSTNTRARQLAQEGAPHGMMIVADSQTAGRGRFDRVFYSPEGTGLYVSFVLRPQIPPEKTVLLTTMAATAVCGAIESVAPVRAGIKWVNDIYLERKKVCGILCEAHLNTELTRHEYAVLGIGINVGKMDFPEHLKDIATSVGNICGQDVSRNKLLAALCGALEAEYTHLEDGGFMRRYRERQIVLGQTVTVLRGEERFSAKALDVDDDGRLILETAQGVQTLGSGEISVKL